MKTALRWMVAAVVAVGFATGALAQAQKTKMTIATGVDPSLGTFYVAYAGGLFEKNGLDVTLRTGPSGSAMVGFLVQNQVQAALGGEIAGIQNFNLDPNVTVVASTVQMPRYFGVVAKGVDSFDALKGKKIGVSIGSASDVFWRAIVEKKGLNVKDYTIVNVEPPEMLAALQRGNIDAFVAWEPWLTRTTEAVPGSKIVLDNDGIIDPRAFLYINRGWATQNPQAAVAFMRSLNEASQLLRDKPDEGAKLIAGYLKMEVPFTRELTKKVNFDLIMDQAAVDALKKIEVQLKDSGKLAKPVDWEKFVYTEPLKTVLPAKVGYSLSK